jgi:CheY-like chemotaxis protein
VKDTEGKETSPEMSRLPGAAPARRPKVLVVDDDDVCRAVVREALEEGGFDVVELGSPIGMSSVVNHEKPDLVLMDLEMPAIEGDKAVEILLKHRLHECKILLYSGRSEAELEQLARSCGASGYVPKSVTDAALAAAIRAHLPA